MRNTFDAQGSSGTHEKSRAGGQLEQNARRDGADSQRRGLIGLPGGLLITAYFAVMLAVYLGSLIAGVPGVNDPATAALVMARNPFVWVAVVCGWLADVLISRRGLKAHGALSIRIGRYRFFHGPLITTMIIAATTWGWVTGSM